MARLIVDGLPVDFSTVDVARLFAEFGTVVSVEIVEGPLGESMRFGHVEMSSEAEALAAVAGLDYHSLQGRRIRVALADDRHRNAS